MLRSHLRRSRNRPALAEMPLIAVKHFRLDDARRRQIGRPEVELKARILADRDIGFEPKYRLAIIGYIERLHKVGRDVVARHLINLQTRIVRMTYQQLHLGWIVRLQSLR